MSQVKYLLEDTWNMFHPQRRPHLALSLIGGAKNFKMDSSKKGIFKRGLIAGNHCAATAVSTQAGIMPRQKPARA